MDYILNYLLDFRVFDLLYHIDSGTVLPAIATASVILLISGKLYSKIRVRFPVKVNCWFCNGNTRVPYNSSNSWHCPQCDQYNGFNTDGGYNRPVVEQWSERMNRGVWCERRRPSPSPSTNGLCRFCNLNLQLKVRQLAHFVPTHPANYDAEVQLYSDRLERVYRLCGRCDLVLANTLRDKARLAGAATPSPCPSPGPPLPRLRAALAACALATALLPLSPPSPLLPLALLDTHFHSVCWLCVCACGCLGQSYAVLRGGGRGGRALSAAALSLWLALPFAAHFHSTLAQIPGAVVLLVLAVIGGRRTGSESAPPTTTPTPTPTTTPIPDITDATCRSEAGVEGLGLGGLRVGGAGVSTRSQTKRRRHFEARHYSAAEGGGAHQLFKGLTPATLLPPHSPPTPTRCSSLSSGFASQGPPSLADHDSVSQCGFPLSPSPSPTYTVMHVTPPAFSKFYAEMHRYEALCYEPSLAQKVQAWLTPLLFSVLIASNSLLLCTFFSDRYLKTPS